MLRKFKFWCQMFVDDVRNVCPRSEGYVVKDLYLKDSHTWRIDVSDLVDNSEDFYELRFIRHHGRVDFIVSHVAYDGVFVDCIALTPELEKKIDNYIIKKVG